mgnify:CR=1 FL=1
MPDKDFIPKDPLEFDVWFHNFVTKLPLYASKFGISPAEMAQLKTEYENWTVAYDVYLKAQIVFRAAEQNLKDIMGKDWGWKGGDLP